MKLSSSFYLFVIFLFISGVLSAQETNFNRFSVELTTGIHIPFSPKNEITNSDYIAFNQFQVAGRYMFSQKLGIKAHYAYNHFVNSNNSDEGVNSSRVGLEGVANVGKLLNMDYTIAERLGLLLHAGGGITYSKPLINGGVERMGNLMAGLTAEVKLSERFALLADATYVANFSQHYDYNGAILRPKTNSGGLMNVSLGIMYSLGSKKMHADWH